MGLLAAIVLLSAFSGSRVDIQSAKLTDGDTSRDIEALYFKPDGAGPFPAVVLLHTCGVINFLKNRPEIGIERAAVMGFSLGAVSITNYLIAKKMRAPDGPNFFKAAIAVYGHCREIYSYVDTDIPLLQIAAEKDVNSAPSCTNLAKYSPMELVMIKDAQHGFDEERNRSVRSDPFKNKMIYSSEATEIAREAAKAFLARHLGP